MRARTYLGQSVPAISHFLRLFFPFPSDDFGDLGICHARVLSNHGRLMMLPIQHECYYAKIHGSAKNRDDENDGLHSTH